MPQRIIGYVIANSEGNTLGKEGLWRITGVENGHAHPPKSVESIRKDFGESKSRHRPQVMYPVVMVDGEQVVQIQEPITFAYATSGEKRPLVGDCARPAPVAK